MATMPATQLLQCAYAHAIKLVVTSTHTVLLPKKAAQLKLKKGRVHQPVGVVLLDTNV